MSQKQNKIVVIVGTNASGKSGLAVALAKKYNGEVVSADSRQVYRGLDIATGKVTKREMSGIPHHLIDVANPRCVFSANDFAALGRKALADIFSRGKVAIIAGGTGFYIDALLGRIALAGAAPDTALRAQLAKKSVRELFTQLQKLDPPRARDIKNKNEHTNTHRLIRAIEIAISPRQGKKFGHSVAKLDAEVLWLGICVPDDELKARIHERTLYRIKRGMVAEAKRLHARGLSWKRMEELGLEYKHLADYLRNNITKDELIAHIDRDDWRYAKRQRTWFKRNKEIVWLERKDLTKAEKLVRKFCRGDRT